MFSLGKTKPDDDPLGLLEILDSNGMDDAIWAFQTIQGHDRDFRLFGVWCARRVQHLLTDPRSIEALDVSERFANGEATVSELLTAQTAAWSAAEAAGGRRTRRRKMIGDGGFVGSTSEGLNAHQAKGDA